MLNLFFAFHGLGHLDGVLDLVSLFSFHSSLALGSVQYVCHLGVPAINRGVLQATTVGLQTHMQWDCVAIRVLPVRNASRHIAVLHVLRCELARRRAHDHRRSFIRGPTSDLLVLVLRRLERVLNYIRDLDDALDT